MLVVFDGFEAWGLPKILKNEVEFRCVLEASVFLKKGAKREPQGLPNELLLVPFGHLLAYFFDVCVPWGFQGPPPSLFV